MIYQSLWVDCLGQVPRLLYCRSLWSAATWLTLQFVHLEDPVGKAELIPAWTAPCRPGRPGRGRRWPTYPSRDRALPCSAGARRPRRTASAASVPAASAGRWYRRGRGRACRRWEPWGPAGRGLLGPGGWGRRPSAWAEGAEEGGSWRPSSSYHEL